MGFGIATQTGVSAAIQSIPSMMANKGLRNGYGATFAENFTDGTNTLDPRITFSRASNATVTGSNGLIQYAPHNLLTYSEQFDNSAWSKQNTTVTANVVSAPNGTTTADAIIANTTAAVQHRVDITPTSPAATQTFSVYARFFDYQYISLRIGSNGAVFDIQNGAVGNTSGGVTAAIVSVGSGWYRCSIAVSAAANDICRINIENANALATNFAGTGTSGAYVWGAQLEIGSTATTYNPTTVKNLLGYSEAFDNAAWTKSNSFVQTNLLTYSQDQTNAAWTKSNTTTTGSATTAPDGTTTAVKLIASATTSTHYASQDITFNNTGSASYSLYVKAAEYTTGRIAIVGLTTPFPEIDLDFNLTTGTVTTAGSTIVSSSISNVGNGWYRVTLTGYTGQNGSHRIYIYPNLSSSYTGNGTSGIYIWGAQIVQGSVAGDYQQTTSAALPVQYQAPNGTMTADKLCSSTTNSQHYFTAAFTSVAGTSYTFSMYGKAGESSYMQFLCGSTQTTPSSVYANFDLSLGVLGTNSGGSPTITSLGNGWYRCSFTFVAAASASMNIYVEIGNSASMARDAAWTGDGTSGIYIWGAQASDSASLDTYVNNPVAAPTAAAYYGARFDYSVDSTITPSGTNLLTYSEQFDNAAWITAGTVNIAAVANQTTAPNGTNTADSLSDGIATGSRALVTSAAIVSGNAYTLSCYFKAGTATAVQLAGGSSAFGANIWATFNLETGVVGASGSSVTASSITAVGNGWYRCTVSGVATTSTSTNTFAVALVNSPTATRIPSYTSTTSTSVFLWGAQLEYGTTATTYVPTTSAASYSAPVLGTSSKGLLIEEQRTNLLTYSSDLTNVVWVKTNSTLTGNVTVTPDGTQTAGLLVSSSGLQGSARQVVSKAASAITYTATVYAKAAGYNWIQVTFFDEATLGYRFWFNLSTGVVGSSSAIGGGYTSPSSSITSVGNGWYRCSITATSSTALSNALYVYPTNGDGVVTNGNGASGVYVWGTQIEAGAFATSYIPTTTAQVTRSADVALVQGSNFSSWYNVNEGSVSVQFSRDSTSGAARGAWSISSGVTNNAMDYRPNGGNYSVQISGVQQADIYPGGGSANAIVKSSFAYRINDFAASTNAGTVQTDTSGGIPVVSQMQIGGLSSSTGQLLGGWIRQIAYYPTRLQNSQLQAITS